MPPWLRIQIRYTAERRRQAAGQAATMQAIEIGALEVQ
jgi:hypothetical protein